MHARVWRAGTWGQSRVIAATASNEARSSLVFDGQNRLWIAHEISPEGWGKDFGPYDRSPKRTALYQSRQVGLKILVGDQLSTTESDVNLALPLPDGGQRWPKSKKRFRSAAPKLALDAAGRVWLSARVRVMRFDSTVGGTWVNFLTTLGPKGWRTSSMILGTDGWLHGSPALVPAPGSGLYVVSASDGRWRSAALFGPQPWKRRLRSKGAPPARRVTQKSRVTSHGSRLSPRSALGLDTALRATRPARLTVNAPVE